MFIKLGRFWTIFSLLDFLIDGQIKQNKGRQLRQPTNQNDFRFFLLTD